VFGLAVFGIATHAIARAGDVRRIPADLTFEAASTLPVVFMTAWYALRNVGRLREGSASLFMRARVESEWPPSRSHCILERK